MRMQESRHSIEAAGNRLEQVYWSFSGFRVGYTSGSGGPESTVHKGENEMVRFHFNLAGGYDFDYQQLRKSYRVEGRKHNLMYSPEFDMRLHRLSEEVETFGIQIEREAFLQMANRGTEEVLRLADVVARNGTIMAGEQWGGDDPTVFGIVQDIANCQMQGEMKALLIESKTMELILAQLESLNGTGRQRVLLSDKERDQLFAARAYLMNRLHEPPRLQEISLAVGLNEFKLKRGFKALFGSSVYAFLQQERLRLAARWMQDSKVGIGEVAFDLGFSSPQHFSRAFRQCFGIAPRKFRNERLQSGLYTFLP